MSVRSVFFRGVIAALISVMSASAFADLTTSINHLIRGETKYAKIGIYIQNLQTGSVLYEYNGNEPLTPASTTKVFTAAAAYLSLGPEYHYVTTLSTNAPVASTLHGNVYIHFSGDPTLTNRDMDALVRQLRLKGVKTIAGNVVLDQTIFSGSYYGEGWGASDFQRCYAAPIAGAIINGNCSRAGVVHSPNVYAEQMVHNALRYAGVHLTGTIVEGSIPQGVVSVAVHESNSMQNILEHMLKYSDDVYANAIFKTMGKAFANNGSYMGGALAIDSILMAHLGTGYRPPELKDGSGLSTLNQISPQQLVALYDYMYHQPALALCFRRSLPISGQSGTLVYRLNDRLLAGNVYAKTGTFHEDDGGVSSLAGYLILPGRHHAVIAFAIEMNHIEGDTSHAEYLQDQIVKAIAHSDLS